MLCNGRPDDTPASDGVSWRSGGNTRGAPIVALNSSLRFFCIFDRVFLHSFRMRGCARGARSFGWQPRHLRPSRGGGTPGAVAHGTRLRAATSSDELRARPRPPPASGGAPDRPLLCRRAHADPSPIHPRGGSRRRVAGCHRPHGVPGPTPPVRGAPCGRARQLAGGAGRRTQGWARGGELPTFVLEFFMLQILYISVVTVF
jgi:hypothetical protein